MDILGFWSKMQQMAQIADISLQIPQKCEHGVSRAFLAKLVGIGSQTKEKTTKKKNFSNFRFSPFFW